MKERSIVFSTDDICAIRERRKTQFRRIVKTPKSEIDFWLSEMGAWKNAKTGEFHEVAYDVQMDDEGNAYFLTAGDQGFTYAVPCPHGKPGDRLWVKETWQVRDDKSYYTKADCKLHRTEHPGCAQIWESAQPPEAFPAWLSPILMPRWASRLTLQVERVRVERLQEITEADAIAEGIRALPGGGYGVNEPFSAENTAREAFAVLWDSRNGKRAPWASNPWVWVVDFCIVEQ